LQKRFNIATEMLQLVMISWNMQNKIKAPF
jgi:hypothetical protein